MKFTVEVEDFYLEEEELTKALVDHVKHDVVCQIKASIKDQVQRDIADAVKNTIEIMLKPIIELELAEVVSKKTIMINRSEISIEDHVKKMFMDNSGWSNPNQCIERVAKAFGQELKEQYNVAFANRIVANIKEQGLLKDEVVQLLLGGKTTG